MREEQDAEKDREENGGRAREDGGSKGEEREERGRGELGKRDDDGGRVRKE